MEKIENNDILRIRELAKQWMEVATSPEMQEKKLAWKASRDLKSVRPVIKCDAYLLDDYVLESDLHCVDPELRSVERMMLGKLRQNREVGDDLVLGDVFRIPWKVEGSGYGLDVTEQRTNESGNYAYSYDNPIHEVKDIATLHKQTYSVDRKATDDFRQKMEYVLDGIIPVRVGNMDYVFKGFGFNVMTGCNWCNPLVQLFKYLGYERLLIWLIDEPDAVHELMGFFTQDILDYYHFAESEGLLDYNTDGEFAGSVSYGFCSSLPQPDEKPGPAKLKDLWGWCEAQESVVISPVLYEKFVAPYLGKIAKEFGLIHYGCCERHDDRYESIVKAIPNVRAFTTTYKWNNIRALHNQCKGKQVIVCKPSPENICNTFPMWEAYEKEIRDLKSITDGRNLEILIGDIMTVYGDWNRFPEAVHRFKKIMGI